MVKRAQVVVGWEHDLAIPASAQWLARESRRDMYAKASKLAQDAGGHIDNTVQPEIRGPVHVQRETDGAQVVAMAAQFTVLVPDSFDVNREAMESARRWVDWE